MEEYIRKCENIVDLSLKIEAFLQKIHIEGNKLISITVTNDGKNGFHLSINYLSK